MTAFFTVGRPSNSWFSLPLTDLDDISAERRGSLCLNGAFLIRTSLPWASTLWALLASALLGGGGGNLGKEARQAWILYRSTGLKTLGRSAEPWGSLSDTRVTPWQRKTARKVCICKQVRNINCLKFKVVLIHADILCVNIPRTHKCVCNCFCVNVKGAVLKLPCKF